MHETVPTQERNGRTIQWVDGRFLEKQCARRRLDGDGGQLDARRRFFAPEDTHPGQDTETKVYT